MGADVLLLVTTIYYYIVGEIDITGSLLLCKNPTKDEKGREVCGEYQGWLGRRGLLRFCPRSFGSVPTAYAVLASPYLRRYAMMFLDTIYEF